MPAREISLANRHPRLRLDRRAVTRVLHTLDAHAEKFRGGPPAGELSLVFLTDPALAQLHADFLDDPTTTDVITFEELTKIKNSFQFTLLNMLHARVAYPANEQPPAEAKA